MNQCSTENSANHIDSIAIEVRTQNSTRLSWSFWKIASAFFQLLIVEDVRKLVISSSKHRNKRNRKLSASHIVSSAWISLLMNCRQKRKRSRDFVFFLLFLNYYVLQILSIFLQTKTCAHTSVWFVRKRYYNLDASIKIRCCFIFAFYIRFVMSPIFFFFFFCFIIRQDHLMLRIVHVFEWNSVVVQQHHPLIY